MTKLRLATLADEPDVQRMADAFHLEDGHPLRAGSAEAIRVLLRGSPLGQVYLIEAEQRVVGYCALCYTMSLEFGGTVTILDDFFVRPEFRGRGVGRKVLAQIEALAREKKSVQIFLEVENANERAAAFYETCGFSFRERRMMDCVLRED